MGQCPTSTGRLYVAPPAVGLTRQRSQMQCLVPMQSHRVPRTGGGARGCDPVLPFLRPDRALTVTSHGDTSDTADSISSTLCVVTVQTNWWFAMQRPRRCHPPPIAAVDVFRAGRQPQRDTSPLTAPARLAFGAAARLPMPWRHDSKSPPLTGRGDHLGGSCLSFLIFFMIRH